MSLAFGKRKVFDGMSCRMRKGEIHLLLGGSGTGKSTLLRMIGGLQRPDSGDVRVAGHLLSEKSERELGEIRKGIGMLFQNGALLDSMTVLENVGLPLREHLRQPWAEIATHVARVLKSVGLDGVEGLLPRQLSGGMLRRVAFARAIVMEPEILLCDEPFSGLDPINVSRIEDLLVELNRKLGLTIVVTSHHMASSLRMAHQMILLRRGGCVAGTSEELASSSDPESPISSARTAAAISRGSTSCAAGALHDRSDSQSRCAGHGRCRRPRPCRPLRRPSGRSRSAAAEPFRLLRPGLVRRGGSLGRAGRSIGRHGRDGARSPAAYDADAIRRRGGSARSSGPRACASSVRA